MVLGRGHSFSTFMHLHRANSSKSYSLGFEEGLFERNLSGSLRRSASICSMPDIVWDTGTWSHTVALHVMGHGKIWKKNTTFGKLLSQYMWTQMRYCLHINLLSMESFDPQICHSDSIKALTIFLRMRRCSCKSNETSMDRAGPFNRMQPSTNSEASKSPLPDASLAN